MADDPQVKAITERLRAEIAQASSALTLEITANLIAATPVDTGHARANWVPSVGTPYTGESDGSAQATGMAAVAAYTLADGALHVSNNVPYINRLIAGSSTQAAPGWDLEAIDRAVATVQARHDATDIDVTVGGTAVTIAPRGDVEP